VEGNQFKIGVMNKCLVDFQERMICFNGETSSFDYYLNSNKHEEERRKENLCLPINRISVVVEKCCKSIKFIINDKVFDLRCVFGLRSNFTIVYEIAGNTKIKTLI